jgi:hypothetical protein
VWSEDTLVRPEQVPQIDDKAAFVSNYVCMRPSGMLKCILLLTAKAKTPASASTASCMDTATSQLDIGSKRGLNGQGQQS